MTICQDSAFALFPCVLSLSSVLERFTYLLYCDTGSLRIGVPLQGKIPPNPPPPPPLFLSHIPNIHISCKHIIEDRGTSPIFQHFINCFKWYESQDLDKFLPFSDVFWMYPLSPFIRLIPSFFKKQKLLMWYTYWARFPDMGSVVLQF